MRKKTHEEFCEEMKSINSNIEVIGKYISARDNIKVRCFNCKGEWEPMADSLLRGVGCPYCCNSPKRILVGFNDMWTTNSNLAKFLKNPEDGYKYTQTSGVKVDWKCPDCGCVVKNKIIRDYCRNGFLCPRCSDGKSYPEKFTFSILQQLNVLFETQKMFKWSQNKRYDFYIPSINCIIETHGRQHYHEGFNSISDKARNLIEEQNNDKLKRQLAINNKIENYYIIDCSESSCEYIKQNVINSDISKILDESPRQLTAKLQLVQ